MKDSQIFTIILSPNNYDTKHQLIHTFCQAETEIFFKKGIFQAKFAIENNDNPIIMYALTDPGRELLKEKLPNKIFEEKLYSHTEVQDLIDDIYQIFWLDSTDTLISTVKEKSMHAIHYFQKKI